jgi:hypothetical protein
VPKGGKGQEDNTFRQLLQQYEQMVAKAGELTVYEQTVNLLQTERYAKLTEGERQRILDLAKRVDAETQHAKIVKQAKDSEIDIQREADEAAARFWQNELRRSAALEQELKGLKQTYEDLADPLARFGRQMSEIARLRGAFPQMAETWDAAEQSVLRAASGADQFRDELDKVSESGRDMGHAIGTAFEDAVVEMKDASDAAKALAQDFARIMLRQAVTKPLEGLGATLFQGLIGAMSGTQAPAPVSTAVPSFIAPRAGGGDVWAGRPYLIGERGPELFVPGRSGTVVPNGAIGAGNTSIDARTYVDARGATQDALPGIVAALGNHERAIARLLENDPYRRGRATRQLLRR